jgi:hypothetical protein
LALFPQKPAYQFSQLPWHTSREDWDGWSPGDRRSKLNSTKLTQNACYDKWFGWECPHVRPSVRNRGGRKWILKINWRREKLNARGWRDEEKISTKGNSLNTRISIDTKREKI